MDAATGKELRVVPTGGDFRHCPIAFSPDGRRISTLSPFDPDGNSVQVWDLASGSASRTISGVQMGHVVPTFSPDGRTLVTWGRYTEAGNDPDLQRRSATVQFWEVSTGMERGRIVADDSELRGVAYSSDGRTLAVAAGDQVSLWDTGTCKRRTSWRPALRCGLRSDLVG